MDPISNIWQVALALIVVVGLVFVLGFVARRLQGVRQPRAGAQIQILESAMLGAKERLVLVEVAGQQVLLGVHPQAITTLMDIPSVTAVKPQVDFDEVLKTAAETIGAGDELEASR